jgi:hypothetical protein
MALERGFKTWAERTALSLRRDLGLSPDAPMNPTLLAEYLQVRLCTPGDIDDLPDSVRTQLLVVDPWGWSAVSQFSSDHAMIIYNPHSKGRQASDIMHELAHFILAHDQGPLIMSHDGTFVMRSYDRKQEDEANWLAWTLLLPREALLDARRSSLSIAAIAEQYGVSEPLVTFRLQTSGIEAQLRAASRHRSRRASR